MTILILLGCQSNSLREDFSLGAQESNYKSAEIKIDEISYQGLAISKVHENEPFLFSVGGIYSGAISVKSIECNIDLYKTYKNFEYVKFLINLNNNKRCLLSINIFPYFEAEISNTNKWKSISGLLILKVDKYESNYQTYQIKDYDNLYFPFITKEDQSRVFIKGCDYKLNKIYSKGSMSINIPVKKLKLKDVCILEGFIKNKSQNESVTILVTKYDLGFSPLPIPDIVFNDNYFEVNADHNVTLIGLGDQYYFKSYAKFRYKKAIDTIRLYTIKGRSLTCLINQKEKAFQCLL